MGACVFRTKDVRRCVEHALAATNWTMGWGNDTPPQPGLYFVHDQGVYLMSNGEPRDLVDGSAYVAYADGCNPNEDAVSFNADWWETSRSLVGGDDFGEVIPIQANILEQIDYFLELVIDITADEIALSFRSPKPMVKA